MTDSCSRIAFGEWGLLPFNVSGKMTAHWPFFHLKCVYLPEQASKISLSHTDAFLRKSYSPLDKPDAGEYKLSQ